MFSSLTQPKYPKAALGLEPDSVTALSLQKESGGFGIKQAATIELPSQLLTPNFLEKNIVNREEMMAFIEEAVVGAGLKNTKRWSISLPGNAARAAILTLDEIPASKAELEEVLDWKAETTFGAPAGEMRITRRKIRSDREGKTRYFATAVKLSVIDEYETIFETFGWHAGLILPRALSEANWLVDEKAKTDSMLISSQTDGFTALLLRGDEPAVVRSVTCDEEEIDDEIYRLLMFYHDRIALEERSQNLSKILAIGENLIPEKIREIAQDALGESLQILRPQDIGLNIPVQTLNFNDVAAPAGVAALGF